MSAFRMETPRFTPEDLGFPNEVVAAVVRSALSPSEGNPDQIDSFLVSALLRILNGQPLPIHTVARSFERAFKLPFRAFRQPSIVAFLQNHSQFQIFDAYVAPSGSMPAFPPPAGAGPRYYALCDALEEQDVVIWRLREELSSLEMAYGGLVQNSGKLSSFLADSDAIKGAANHLTFKIVCQTPEGIELPILIEPRGPLTADADEDVAVARKALTRVVEREVAILRKTDETIGLEMTDHKRQIATLRLRMEQEMQRLEAMYADAYSMVPFQSMHGMLPPFPTAAAEAKASSKGKAGQSMSPRRSAPKPAAKAPPTQIEDDDGEESQAPSTQGYAYAVPGAHVYPPAGYNPPAGYYGGPPPAAYYGAQAYY